MTGIKSEQEATLIATQMIKYIQSTRINIYTNISEFEAINKSRSLYIHPATLIEYYLVAFPHSNGSHQILYFRYGYDKYFIPNVSTQNVENFIKGKNKQQTAKQEEGFYQILNRFLFLATP